MAIFREAKKPFPPAPNGPVKEEKKGGMGRMMSPLALKAKQVKSK